jgi:hypothetical protein
VYIWFGSIRYGTSAFIHVSRLALGCAVALSFMQVGYHLTKIC